MSLVYIEAQAPWGPIRLHGAADYGDMIARVTTAPGHVADVGDRETADVIAEAARMMARPDALGWIAETVARASNFVTDAILHIPAVVVARDPVDAGPGQPVSRGGPIASDGETEAAISVQYAAACVPEAADNTATANCDTTVRRRPGAEVDARAIRAGLGMSQPAFAETFGLKLAVLRDWEQGRTKPEGASRVLLMTIAHRPEAVRDAVLAFHDLGM